MIYTQQQIVALTSYSASRRRLDFWFCCLSPSGSRRITRLRDGSRLPEMARDQIFFSLVCSFRVGRVPGVFFF